MFESSYKEDIFRLAKSKENKIFYNSSEKHASIVHQAIMKYAENYVYILCSSLCTDISNNTEYCSLTDEFLSRDCNHQIKIIFTSYEKDFKNKDLFKVFDKYPLQVEMRKFDGKVTVNNKPIHFTISDDRAYRFETDIEKHMAFGNFNGKTQAMSLKEKFLIIFNDFATPID